MESCLTNPMAGASPPARGGGGVRHSDGRSGRLRGSGDATCCTAAPRRRKGALPPAPPSPITTLSGALGRAAPRASDDVASTLAVPGNPDGVSCATADLSAGQVGQLYALDALRAGFL